MSDQLTSKIEDSTPLFGLLWKGEKICFKDSMPNEFMAALQTLLHYGSCPYTEQGFCGETSLEWYSGSTEAHRLLINSLPPHFLPSEYPRVLENCLKKVAPTLWS
jgi:hypothetical protein